MRNGAIVLGLIGIFFLNSCVDAQVSQSDLREEEIAQCLVDPSIGVEDQLVVHSIEREASPTITGRSVVTGSGLASGIGLDGCAYLIYFDETKQRLILLRCTTTQCSENRELSLSTVSSDVPPSSGWFGLFPDLVLTDDGLPRFAYSFDDRAKVGFTECLQLMCQDQKTILVDSNQGDETSGYTSKSLTLGPDANPVIAYSGFRQNSDVVKVFVCSDRLCASSSTATIAESPGRNSIGDPDVAVLKDGRPIVTFVKEKALWTYVCGDPQCMIGSLRLLDTVSSNFVAPKIRLARDGNPMIVYSIGEGRFEDGETPELRVTSCRTPDCKEATIVPFQVGKSTSSDGRFAYWSIDNLSFELDAEDKPRIVYSKSSDTGLSELWQAKCEDLLCNSLSNRKLFNIASADLAQVDIQIGQNGIFTIVFYEFLDDIKVVAIK